MDLAEENLTNPSPSTPSSSLPIHLIPDLDTPLSPPTDLFSYYWYSTTVNSTTSTTSYFYTQQYRYTLIHPTS